MRIGEALSLNRDQIDVANREARIIGKGNKERVAFFTARALCWLQQYLNLRTDSEPAVFVVESTPHRLKRHDIWRAVSTLPHACGHQQTRHAASAPSHGRNATTVQWLPGRAYLQKTILGHERLETTCRYYLRAETTERQKLRMSSILPIGNREGLISIHAPARGATLT